MSTFLGLAGMSASDYEFVRNIDKELVYTATNEYVQQVVAYTNSLYSLFVAMDTVKYTERNKLGMTGKMQKVTKDADGKNNRPYGGFDVGYPIENYKEFVAITDVDMAKMTTEAFQQHVDGITTLYQNRVRHEILYALLNNTQKSVVDDYHGTIAVEPLANGDGVVYPPLVGSDTEAADDHYLGLNYTAANISDTNNPYVTLKRELLEHYGGGSSGGDDVIALIHSDQEAKTAALTDFYPVRDIRVSLNGTDSELAQYEGIPFKVIGRVSGVTVASWDWIPTGYIVTLNRQVSAPLKRRVDSEAELGGGGLQNLEPFSDTALTYNRWRARFGFGVHNRLAGAVGQLVASTSYTIPTLYA